MSRHLSDDHRRLIENSAISETVAISRGYWTATRKVELADLGFVHYQRSVPALVVPIHGVHGGVVNYQARPDSPRIDAERGKPIKYETIAAGRMVIDVPPLVKPAIADPARDLWITEGARKADALVSAGLSAIALLGVWNWRGTNDHGGKTALADWDAIALNDRCVFLAFDSDAMTKPSVHDALGRLARFLQGRGAHVRFVYLPQRDDEKIGVDDFFALDGTVKELRDLAEEKLRPAPQTGPPRKPPEPTARLLNQVAGLITRHVALPGEHELVALCLYVLHTRTLDASRVTPYLLVHSPAKRSGKTRLLETLELVVHEPLRAAGVTPAALFQAIDRWRPTLLIDEIDAIFTRARSGERTEELRGVLNAGNARGSFVVRGSQDGEPVKFSIFCPKILAGIDNGALPDTIRDRCIVIGLERKRADQKVARLRPTDILADVLLLRGMLDDWGAAHSERLAEFRADPIPEISDRLDEAWEPLLAIADLAGGNWPARARAAAVALAGKTEDEHDDLGLMLLSALRHLFQGELADKEAAASKTICKHLNEQEEAPFGALRGGQGLDGLRLSRLLRPYGVKSQAFWSGGKTLRGYRRDEFSEVWGRYLPASERTTDSSESPQEAQGPQERRSEAESGLADGDPDPQGVQEAQGANGSGMRVLADLAGLADKQQALWCAPSDDTRTLADLTDEELLATAGPGATLEEVLPPAAPVLLTKKERALADRNCEIWPWLSEERAA